MVERQRKVMKLTQLTLGILVIASFVFFVVMQLALPAENNNGIALRNVYKGQWEQIREDGSREKVTLPVQLECQEGQWAVLETTLPEDVETTWLCLRSLQQDMKIYVGDELRKEYSTLDSQLFGKTSTIAYVWVSLSEKDAGETMRVEFMSDSFYSGYMEEILTGEKWDILSYLIGQYGASTFLALFLFVVGLVVMIACQPMVSLLGSKGNMEMFSLGIVVVMASSWLLVESKLRQFIFNNSTIAMYMGFLIIMLLPYAFLGYLNRVQKGRYEKAYTYFMIWTVVNFLVCTGLQVFEIKDFFETMTSSHILLAATIVAIMTTIVLDIKKGFAWEYRPVAIGFGVILLAGIIEIGLSYTVNAKINGVPLCLSLIGLVCAAGIKVAKEVTSIEREKQVALEAKKSQALFLANMSHEIRTPINTIMGMNEMILREEEDKAITGYAMHIKRAGNMLLGLINEILDFSKIEAGKLEIVADDYSLTSLLSDVHEGVKKRAKEKGLSLFVDIKPDLPATLRGDELRIKQILNNLLSNAVKYTEKGSVYLTVEKKEEGKEFALCMCVKDTGIGIRQEDIPHLFDSFQRLELQKNRHIQGTGLGLCITKQLVEAMNGSIEVESVHGSGSCFKVVIPQIVVSVEEVISKETPQEESSKEIFRAPDAVILGVDDNRVNLAVLKALLKRTEVKVELAISGKQALERTREKKYDLILMDHMMPEMDGIETLHTLRKEKENPNRDTKVIALTANAIQGAEKEYLKEGFDDYLSKPIDPVKIENLLRKYLSEKQN